MTALSDAQVGDELPAQSFRVHRADLVRYAGASGENGLPLEIGRASCRERVFRTV